jgi:hypothetical protein
MRRALALCIALSACSGDGSREAPAEQEVREAVGATQRDTARAASASESASAITPRAEDACGRPVVDGSGIGAIRLGMPAETVKTRCLVVRDTVELRSEGQQERILVVAFGTDTAHVEVNDGRVWRIEITNPGLRTADWIGVGTPLSALLALKGGMQGLTGEGSLFLITEAKCGLSFELSEPRSPSGTWPEERLRKLPASTVVKRILVVGCETT